MLARAEQDAPANPILADLLRPFASLQACTWDIVLVQGAVGLALAFSTWRSLVREQGLDHPQAVALMAGPVSCASGTRAIQ